MSETIDVTRKEPRDAAPLHETPLAALHTRLGARMVPFAGYAMPLQYPSGILAEHRWTREKAGLFDVSHMGQADVMGVDAAAAAVALERAVCGNIKALKPGKIRYTLLMNDAGGIIDDLMVTHAPQGEKLWLVVNASRKAVDYAALDDRLAPDARIEPVDDAALLALQGPMARAVMAEILPIAASLPFMAACETTFHGRPIRLSCCGYTGEDGFEISVPAGIAIDFAEMLLADDRVAPVGLGARDSLRLEAGLPLYGQDIDETTSPVEADLGFAIGKARRETGGYPGAERIAAELADAPGRIRVGLALTGRAPAREGAAINAGGEQVGVVTSGGFAPSLGGPIALGYVPPALAAPGTALDVMVRGKALGATVTALPFVAHRYLRRV